MKDASIIEGGLARQFNNVAKLKISQTSGGLQEWIPQDEAREYIHTKDKTIAENGTYIARNDGCDAYESVEVKFPVGEKYIIQDGTYRAADENLDGYSGVGVSVRYRVKSKKITQEGMYLASDDGVDGYDYVEIQLKLPKKIITANGTYRSSTEGISGYGELEVNIPDAPPGKYPKGWYETTAIADEDIEAFDTVLVQKTGNDWHMTKTSSIPEDTSNTYLAFVREECEEGARGRYYALFNQM